MESTFIAALAGLTSIGAYFVGARALGLSSTRLGAAVGKMLESVGMTLIFLAANLTTSVLIVLAVRSLTGTFVSAYATDDVVWLGVSLIQGLAFQAWRGSDRYACSSDRRRYRSSSASISCRRPARIAVPRVGTRREERPPDCTERRSRISIGRD